MSSLALDSGAARAKLDAFVKANPASDIRVEGADPLDLNVKNLLTKQVDAVIEDRNVFMFKSGQLRLTDMVELAGDTGPGEDLYLAFSEAAFAERTLGDAQLVLR